MKNTTPKIRDSSYCLDLGGSTIDMIEFSSLSQNIITKYTVESHLFCKKESDVIFDILERCNVLQEIEEKGELFITGGHSHLFPDTVTKKNSILFLKKISEFEAIAKGGCFLASKNSGLVISLGTGTAMISVSDISKNRWEHVRGTGIGGGTFLGLGRALLQEDTFNVLEDLAKKGNLSSVDISVGDIVGGSIGNITPDMTASNFGKFSQEFSRKEDIALGIANLVGQSIASLAVEKARVYRHSDIILGGKFSRFPLVVDCIQKTANIFDMNILVPKNSGFMTALGGCL